LEGLFNLLDTNVLHQDELALNVVHQRIEQQKLRHERFRYLAGEFTYKKKFHQIKKST